MFNLNTLYKPLTAHPFQFDNTYREYLPCDTLSPFIACYWGMAKPTSGSSYDEEMLHVIPDTCMDIIFEINHTDMSISSRFSGIDDRPFIAASQRQKDFVSRFAIRFHSWAAHLFVNFNMQETHNKFLLNEPSFQKWVDAFEPFLFLDKMDDRVKIAEAFLLTQINIDNCNNNVLNAFYHIFSNQGAKSIKDICSYTCVSQRQLERLFLSQIGISIKGVSNLVRYQNVWHDIVFSNNFSIHDAVIKYGYTDQSHLLHEFKKYHGMNIKQAKELAYTFVS